MRNTLPLWIYIMMGGKVKTYKIIVLLPKYLGSDKSKLDCNRFNGIYYEEAE